MRVILEDLHSIIEWQCAHDAMNHAVKGKQITLTYGVPDGEEGDEGDLTLFVVLDSENLIVSKKDLLLPELTTKG